MFGGIHAKRGFNYQDTVTLDLLLTFFGEQRASGSVRPEGMDDLEFAWEDSAGSTQRRFVQVKKPREDNATNPTNLAWSLAQIISDLIPDTLNRLKGNSWRQDWILGDGLSQEAFNLVDAGKQAPVRVTEIYWQTVHLLARNKVLAHQRLDDGIRGTLMNWRPAPELLTNSDAALSHMEEEFGSKLVLGASEETAENYSVALRCINDVLPDVLSRVRCRGSFGSIDEVSERVQRRLHEQYDLDADTVSETLFRNLRGFVSDISTIPNLWFDAEDFAIELRAIWPTMVPVRTPPPLEPGHIRRPHISAAFTSQWNGRALEAVGISGAGKTMLAAEVYEKSRKEYPRRPVFYVEVGRSTRLRDVLVGVAFHLRRYGYTHPFRVASTHVQGETARDVAIQELVQGLGSVPEDILLLIDMVEGRCSEDFSREVKVLANSITGTGCRFAFLGQESPFQDLTDVERQHLLLRTLHIDGFNFEEFLKLVHQSHEELDFQALHGIFNAVTAGRRAGMYAHLARTLADTPSIPEMRELSASPPESVLQRAEQRKFERLSASARSAAEKLVCFALPFSRIEAINIFEDESIGLALQELLELGLLRKADEVTFEMHETVRAGLEDVIPSKVRKEAHTALAAHYGENGMVPAEILHLEKAGFQDRAQERARNSFLQGNHWAQLCNFIVAHQLVNADEVMDVVASSGNIDGGYLLSDIMSKLSEPTDAEKLLNLIRRQLTRFGTDFNWALNIADACLTLKPDYASELYRLAMLISDIQDGREHAISSILIASRRHSANNTQSLVALFDSLRDEEKLLFVPVLLENGNRHCLSRAFGLITSHMQPAAGQRTPNWGYQFLRVQSLDDVVEFLASIPEVSDAEMLVLQSPLLGRLTNFVWANRDTFRAHAVKVLQSDDFDQRVQKAAIRVLALIGDSQLCHLCDTLSAKTDNPVHGFAALAPTLAPTQIDMTRYEARFLNEDNSHSIRLASLYVLAAAGADLNILHQRLYDVEETPGATAIKEFYFLMMACEHPYRAALPLLQVKLSSSMEDNGFPLWRVVRSLGALGIPEATEMLESAVTNADPLVRVSAALGLQEKRNQVTRVILKEQFRSESHDKIRGLLAAAICASGPSSVDDVDALCAEDQSVTLWQCVVAARTRDQEFAGNLVTIALDTSLSWQLRREAITAAGFLPFEAALEHLLPILRERSTLLVDDHTSLYAHSFLHRLLEHESQRLLQLYLIGREDLVSFVSEVYLENAETMLGTQGSASAIAVGEWLYDRLSAAGPPFDCTAIEEVINELSSPLIFSAMLRSLRRRGRADLVENEIAKSDKRWFAARCIIECKKSGYKGVEDADRLGELLDRSSVAHDGRLINIIEEIRAVRGSVGTLDSPRETLSEEGDLVPTILKFEEAKHLLTTGTNDQFLNEQCPVLLVDLTEAQFRLLVELAGPEKDPEAGVENYLSGIVFGEYGHTVATRQFTYSSGGLLAGDLIRPALVAANSNGIKIEWHETMLHRPFAEAYVQRVLRCVAVAGNSNVLFDLLKQYSEAFLLVLGSHSNCRRLAPLIDGRIVPILGSNVSAGTDEMLECLTRIAQLVETPDMDTVLGMLLKRWTNRFKASRLEDSMEQSPHFWRAFQNLSNHTRFREIDGWHRNLAPVLHSPRLPWYHRRDIARVLEGNSGSYIQLEILRLRAQDWEHFYDDEIDWLDAACERLFGKYQK